MSVSFYFRITNIQGREGVPPRVCNSGLWRPPAGTDSVAISSQLFYFDGATVHDVTYSVNPPAGSQVFRACSMYHDQGRFWAVNYDATQYPVDQGNRQDWYQLGFDHSDHTSWVGIGGEQRRLGYQSPNQPWLRVLFPDNHQPERYTNDRRYGGLGGHLPLIIALIAFSISPAYLYHALSSCMRAGPWGSHQYPHGRSDGRGMVVTIYTVPGASSKEVLSSFEDSRVFPT